MAVHILDLKYLGIPQALAAFVIVDESQRHGPVIIETGPASTLPQLLDGLRTLAIDPRDIRHALVTHIHLDHAGAAGALAREFSWTIHVHEFGAKHLAEPAKLIESATRIYGEQMDRLWGKVEPVPPSLLQPVHDGDILNFDGLVIRAIETPGHARHHHAFAAQLDGERIGFAGDAAGFNAPASSRTFISVPTPPPEFDLEAWLATIDRLHDERFDALYLTHFGRVEAVDWHLKGVREALGQHAAFVDQRLQAGDGREEILRAYIAWQRAEAQAHGLDDAAFARYVSRNLLTMNVHGMERYWRKRRDATPP